MDVVEMQQSGDGTQTTVANVESNGLLDVD
jgi:hypothetical protein